MYTSKCHPRYTPTTSQLTNPSLYRIRKEKKKKRKEKEMTSFYSRTSGSYALGVKPVPL